MKSEAIGPWRRLAAALQALFIIGIPFLKIEGESALRFDIPSLRLHFFGSQFRVEEFFVVLIALIFITFLIVLVTLIFGRVWCGWVCPQTVIADYTSFVERARSKGFLSAIGSYTAIFAISSIVAADLIWYFVSPYEFIERLISLSLGNVLWGFWIVLTGVFFLDFAFLRRTFCATVCPYAKLQSVLYDSKTLVIAFDPERREECMNCMACVKTCPVGIDIRQGLNAACINCAECIDACTEMMAKRQRKGLIGYFFGLPGETGRILRQNAVLIGSVTALSLIFLVYLLITRMPIDMTVLPNHAFPPRITTEGAAVNSYLLSVRNSGKTDVRLYVRAEGSEGALKTTPEMIIVKAGEDRKIPVYVFMKDFEEKEKASIEISIMSGKPDVTVRKKASFIVPERS